MLVHKGGQIDHWGRECKYVTTIKLQCQTIQKALQVILNFKKRTGGRVGAVGPRVNQELKVWCCTIKKTGVGGGRMRCEPRIEGIVQLEKMGARGGGGLGEM